MIDISELNRCLRTHPGFQTAVDISEYIQHVSKTLPAREQIDEQRRLHNWDVCITGSEGEADRVVV